MLPWYFALRDHDLRVERVAGQGAQPQVGRLDHLRRAVCAPALHRLWGGAARAGTRRRRRRSAQALRRSDSWIHNFGA